MTRGQLPILIQKKILDQNLCLGCGLCEVASPQIKMEKRNERFYEPVTTGDVNERVVAETILSCCPGINVHGVDPPRNSLEKVWGRIEYIATGHSTSERLRFEASSGGALSALAICLLEEKKVDGVIHVGPSDENPLLNKTYLSTTSEQIRERCGSRYAPTSPVAGLRSILQKDGTFAFIGKPCDVGAVRQFLQVESAYQNKITWLLSFFCAGQPSFAATHELLHHLQTEPNDVSRLRYRGHGWPGRATALNKDGSEHSCSYDESWGKILGRDIHLRCRICPDATGMLADVVCADAWESDAKGYPIFEERPGRSLIMARNKKGTELVQLALSKGYIDTSPFDAQKLQTLQSYQAKRRSLVLPRMLALRLKGIRGIKFNGLSLWYNTFRGNWKHSISNFWGMFKRIPPRR